MVVGLAVIRREELGNSFSSQNYVRGSLLASSLGG